MRTPDDSRGSGRTRARIRREVGVAASSGAVLTYRSVLAVREFRATLVAQVLSVLGDQVAAVCLAVLVFDRSRSTLLATLSYAVVYLPGLLVAPVLNLLADTRPRRTVLITCDALRAVVTGLMALPGVPLPVLFGLLFVGASLGSPFSAARAALLPEILGEERYPRGQALVITAFQLGSVVGFLAGGAVAAGLSPRAGLALDALSFALSAVLLRLLLWHRPAAAAMPHGPVVRGWLHASAEGARIVAADPLLRRVLSLALLGAAVTVVPEGVAVAYARDIGGGPLTTGLLTAAEPAGVVLGAIVFGRLLTPERRPALLRPLALLACAPLVLTAVRPPLAVTAGLWVLSGAGGAFQIGANAVFSAAVPPEALGRAFGFAATGLGTVQGVALLAGGAVGGLVPVAWVVAGAGVLGVVGTWAVTSGPVWSAFVTSAAAASHDRPGG